MMLITKTFTQLLVRFTSMMFVFSLTLTLIIFSSLVCSLILTGLICVYFLADRTNGHTLGTVLHLSSSVCNLKYCG